MADGGYLAPPSEDPSKEKIWVETRKRLERFLPDLFAEIFPDKLEEPQPEVPSTTATPSAEKDAVSPTATADAASGEQQPGSPAPDEDDVD